MVYFGHWLKLNVNEKDEQEQATASTATRALVDLVETREFDCTEFVEEKATSARHVTREVESGHGVDAEHEKIEHLHIHNHSHDSDTALQLSVNNVNNRCDLF